MRSTILILLFLPMLFSCADQEEPVTSGSGQPEDIPAGIARVSFASGSPSRCVYIFRREGNTFRYDSMIDTGWSADGKLTARLLVGDYKFLFLKPLNGQIDVLPASLDKAVTIDQLRFAAQEDATHPGGILPVEELFLPQPEVADSVYTIQGEDKIECTLQRRVSQLEFVLNRGYKDGDNYVAQPYEAGENILQTVKELRVEISGVARESNYLGTSGEGTVFCQYAASDRQSIDEQGFATFTGPFVFPPANGGDVHLAITLVPLSGPAYPTLQLPGKIEANRKLVVNLWLSASYFDIGVTIDNLPISGRTDGDSGMWE